MPLAPVTKIILCLLRNARRARASWESGKCRPELLSNHIHPRQAGLEAFLLAVLEKAVARRASSRGRKGGHPRRFCQTQTARGHPPSFPSGIAPRPPPFPPRPQKTKSHPPNSHTPSTPV